MADSTLTQLLAGIMLAYVVVMFVIGSIAQRWIRTVDDFNVAGRRLGLGLAWATLLATWFGAGTLLTQADEVRNEGLHKAALDPWGAGVCLVIAGLFFARPLWEMKLLTLPDFFRRRFGPAAELFAALIMVPSYFGWIAVQFVALGTVLNALFGLDLNLAIFLVAMVGMGYTLQGGMWSVTLTDAVQMTLILIGLLLLGMTALARLGGGDWLYGGARLLVETDPLILRPVPTESLTVLGAWLGVFCIGALGNIPAQDLTQRIFAAKSGDVARRACLIAGGLYLAFGSIPLMLALAGRLLLPDTDEAIIMELARELLRPHPLAYIVFILAVVSAVLSTIDSAILAPASVLSQNVLGRMARRHADPAKQQADNLPSGGQSPTAVRWSVFGVTMASLAMAYMGEDAYALLEGAYTLPFVGLFVPLTLGLYLAPRGQRPALISMCVGTGIWLAHYAAEIALDRELGFLGSELPVPLLSMLCGLAAYLIPYSVCRPTQ